MYQNHPVREDVAGSVESVNATTREQLQMCYDAFYIPKNMILFVVGDLDLEDVLKVVDQNITEDYSSRQSLPELILPKEPEGVLESEIVQKMDVPVPLFQLGFKDDLPLKDSTESLKKTIAMKLVLDMHFGKGSSFYSKNYDEGLINASFYYEFSNGMEYAHVMFGGESAEYKKVAEAVKAEIERIHLEGIDHSAFERVKRKAIGRYLSAFNSVQYVAGAFVSYFMKRMDLFDYLGLLETIEPEFVEETLKRHLKTEHVVLSVVE